ncbi:2-succinyl-6-hydroxy-2,4-cyclohexadiene-1-carboxylate synthase [uncultured archaeon]|nr:2-succinyl-6-hydroxy-2,4-cyclohexadiene-1-carboxylate synthase [uncultured archaeon]
MKEFYLPGKERIYYRKNAFKAGRKTIIFVHGLSGSCSAWFPYENKFENKYNILTLDIRGHGKSFRPAKLRDYAVDKYVEDLYRIIKKEKLSNLILIGHSFGTMIVMDFLTKHRSLVKSLILISSDAAPAKRIVAKTMKMIFSPSRIMNYLPQYKIYGGHIDYKKYPNTGDWNLRRMIADISNTGLRSYFFSMLQAYDFDKEDDLSKINLPVLVMHGDKDTVCPLNSGIKVNQLIKKSKFVVFNGSNHVVVLNEVDKVSKEIDHFIQLLK